MKRIGLKYISSTGKNFPAINGGKWNIASNFQGDFNKILSEAGIEADDFESISFFMRYVEEGMLLSAVRRQNVRTETGRHYESLWMFVPTDISIAKAEIALAASELAGIYGCPDALTSMEGLEDILPEIFRKEFESDDLPAAPIPKMTGSRVGYIPYDNLAEFEVILSAGYSQQYSNFGLILITDYGVRVEASFPRVFLPELMLFQQLERQKDIPEPDSQEEVDSQEEPDSQEEQAESEDHEEQSDPEVEAGQNDSDVQPEPNETDGSDKLTEPEGEEIKEEENPEKEMEQPTVIVKEITVVPALYKRGLAVSIILNLILIIILLILI